MTRSLKGGPESAGCGNVVRAAVNRCNTLYDYLYFVDLCSQFLCWNFAPYTQGIKIVEALNLGGGDCINPAE